MRAHGAHPALVQDHDPVGLGHCGDPVGDGDDGAPLGDAAQTVAQRRLGVGVQVRGGLVEQHHVGLLEQRPCHAEPLPLSAGESGALVAEEGFEAVRQLRHHLGETGEFDGLGDLRLGGVGRGVHDVLAEGSAHRGVVLLDVADAAADLGGREVGDVPAVEEDRAGPGPVEPLDELEDGGLARAGGAHHGGEPSGGDGERHAFQHRPVAVAEGDVAELHRVVAAGRGRTGGRVAGKGGGPAAGRVRGAGRVLVLLRQGVEFVHALDGRPALEVGADREEDQNQRRHQVEQVHRERREVGQADGAADDAGHADAHHGGERRLETDIQRGREQGVQHGDPVAGGTGAVGGLRQAELLTALRVGGLHRRQGGEHALQVGAEVTDVLPVGQGGPAQRAGQPDRPGPGDTEASDGDQKQPDIGERHHHHGADHDQPVEDDLGEALGERDLHQGGVGDQPGVQVALAPGVEVRAVGPEHLAREQDPGVADDVLARPADETALGGREHGVQQEQHDQRYDDPDHRAVVRGGPDQVAQQHRLRQRAHHAHQSEAGAPEQQPPLPAGQVPHGAAGRRRGGRHDRSSPEAGRR